MTRSKLICGSREMAKRRESEQWREIIYICTLFKLAFISCVFRNPNTLDSIPMKHELTNTFTSKLITTLDVGDFNLDSICAAGTGEERWKIQCLLKNLYIIHLVVINGNRLNSFNIDFSPCTHAQAHTHPSTVHNTNARIRIRIFARNHPPFHSIENSPNRVRRRCIKIQTEIG